MIRTPLSLLAVVSLSILPAWTQQLSDGPPAFMSYPGISEACEKALNTTVDCPEFLSETSSENAILDSERVDVLCSGACQADLQSARAKIAGACTADTDVIVYSNVAYPATFIVDQYILASKISCLQDGSTGEYCDPQFLAWADQSTLTGNESCSDCWLGVQALQLGNPLGYDAGLASDFSSLTASCGSTGYTYATPAGYGLNATATSPGSVQWTNPPMCTGSYTLQPSDDCNSVAKAMGVSTYSLLSANGFDLYCQNFDAAVQAGAALCTPPTCDTYTWSPYDTCNDVARKHNLTVSHFLAWNPNFNAICRNGMLFAGYEVCVSPPGGIVDSGSSTNLTVTSGASTAFPAPTNSFPETKKCGGWYTVQTGDDCGKLSIRFSIPLADFLFLNPEVYKNCTNLLLDVSYCVFPVGDIATYPGYKGLSTLPITVPPATFSSVITAIPPATSHPNPSYTFARLPLASGTVQDCAAYANYNGNTTDSSLNACTYIAFAYNAAFADLLAWNPSLARDEAACALQPGRSYCVQRTDASEYVPSEGQCVAVDAAEIPDGTAGECACFTEVSGYDATVGMDCASVAEDASITLAQLSAWNPWLGADCDAALFDGLEENDFRAVCIGVNATAPTASATSGPTTAVTPTKTSSMGPTQTGVIASCQQFYTVQSGDGCASIQATFAIAFADFLQWNPSVGSNCENLWLGYAYCVRAPAPTTTAGAPPAPTQSGVAATCNAYYTVQSGDSCDKIGRQFGLTLQQLYTWNPAVGADCGNLWLGYAVCVGVS